jgi:hypothetical protein
MIDSKDSIEKWNICLNREISLSEQIAQESRCILVDLQDLVVPVVKVLPID